MWSTECAGDFFGGHVLGLANNDTLDVVNEPTGLGDGSGRLSEYHTVAAGRAVSARIAFPN